MLIIAVYEVLKDKLFDGVNVAVAPLYVTVPVTPGMVSVVALIVDASIISLNVAVIVAFTATPGALFAGLVDDTVGDVVSDAVPVVNVHV